MPNTVPDSPSRAAVIPVAVGVIMDADRQVLIARRPLSAHQGGKWEFPGGKIHEGERPIEALVRELQEELGIHLEDAVPLIRIQHAYPDKHVLLDVWRIVRYSGSPQGRENQPLRWVRLAELVDAELPEADRPIVRALRLPPHYFISSAQREGPATSLAKIERAVRAGARLLQLREPAMAADVYLDYARRAVALCHRHGAEILLNADPAWVDKCGADGVHLTSRRLMSLAARPLGPDRWVAASCHNAAELDRARELNVDFAVLSPVLETPSHPTAMPLGWERFQYLSARARMPVYALGGMRAAHLDQARSAGAQGLAMISGIWESASIEDVVSALC